jgi:flagellar motor component MotA
MSQRDLVDEIAGLAEVARKQGPIGLEKVEIEDPFLAKGVRLSLTATTAILFAIISSGTAIIF